MGYTEKNFQNEFKDRNKMVGVFELKICKLKSLPFSSIAEHQRDSLLKISSEQGLYHKISDVPVSEMDNNNRRKIRFTKKKPFDCFFLNLMPADVVIMFYQPRVKKNVYYIPIKKFLATEKESDRKSITEEMASEAAYFKESYLKQGGKND
ncbi:MAG: hypothetical protein SVO01_07910 [Thermotogota bacterium]|nr:hypothetical protein [Thermotogota bacterium]